MLVEYPEEHEERCGKSWESLKDCIFKYLNTQFPDDAADVQRYYVMNTIKKSAKVGPDTQPLHRYAPRTLQQPAGSSRY